MIELGLWPSSMAPVHGPAAHTHGPEAHTSAGPWPAGGGLQPAAQACGLGWARYGPGPRTIDVLKKRSFGGPLARQRHRRASIPFRRPMTRRVIGREESQKKMSSADAPGPKGQGQLVCSDDQKAPEGPFGGHLPTKWAFGPIWARIGAKGPRGGTPRVRPQLEVRTPPRRGGVRTYVLGHPP